MDEQPIRILGADIEGLTHEIQTLQAEYARTQNPDLKKKIDALQLMEKMRIDRAPVEDLTKKR